MRLFGGEPPLNVQAADADTHAADTADAVASGGAVQVSGELRGTIQRMYVAHITERGVDYDQMKHSDEFARYVAATRLLPRLDVAKSLQDDGDKIAFFVNLYNALTQHGVIARGKPPQSSLGRVSWAMRTSYRVGRYTLSLHDMENGILRGNRRLSVLPAPFGMFDDRRKLRVGTVDPRIHFVLNCAANSCPPVLFITRDNLEYTLDTATKGFLANEDNLQVQMQDDGSCVVRLSLIFKWYKTDFADSGSDEQLLRFVAQHANDAQQNTIELNGVLAQQQGSDEEGRLRLEWLPYDWGLNSV